MPEKSKRPWLHSVFIDILFIFPALWMGPLFVGIYLLFQEASLKYALLTIVITLSGGHLLSPILLYLSKAKIRQHVKSQRPFAVQEMVVLFISAMLLMQLGWYFFSEHLSNKYLFMGVLSLSGGLYHFFNTHHFTKQYFGITSLFLPKVSLKERSFILRTVWLVTFIVPMIAWAFADLRVAFFRHFFESLESPPFLYEVLIAVVMVSFLFLILRGYQKKYLNLQLIFSYVSFCMIIILICLVPLFFTILVSSAVHWLQAIFLTAYQISIDDKKLGSDRSSHGLRFPWIYMVIGLMLVSAAGYFLIRWGLNGKTQISLFGYLNGSYKGLGFESFVVVGALLGLAALHFYLERFIYRSNPYLAPKSHY